MSIIVAQESTTYLIMQYSIKTYMEVKDMVRSYLIQVPNLKEFCYRNQLDYYITCKIKNNTDKKLYPRYLTKILQIMNHDVLYEKIHVFKIIAK